MGDVISNSILSNNLAISASRENQPELRFSNKYEHSSQNPSPAGEDKKKNNVECGYESRAKRMRISLHDMVNQESEKSRNTKPNMTAQAEESHGLSLIERKSEKLLPTEHQTNEENSSAKSLLMSFDSKKIPLDSCHPYPSTTQHALKSQSNCNDIINAGLTESRNSSGAKSENSENMLLHLSFQKNVNASSQEAIPCSKTPPPMLRCDASLGIAPTEPSSSCLSKTAFKSFLSTPGYLANQYNNKSYTMSTPSFSKTNLFATPPGSSMKTPLSCPGRIDSTTPSSSPKVRLSLSLDGKAELVTEKSTSPLNQLPRPRSSFGNSSSFERKSKSRRSKSALLPCIHRSGMGNPNTSLMSRRPMGRSRDARSWAYCCKGEVHDDFARQVEDATLGSAVAAISLIRSSSSPSRMSKPKSEILPNKNTRSNSKAIDQSKLQHTTPTSFKLSSYDFDCVKDYLIPSPSGDSDKENWLPLLNGSPRRRPLPSCRQDKLSSSSRILCDDHEIDFGIMRGPKRKSNDSFIDMCRDRSQLKVVKGVEKPMSGDVNSCKTGDLGAIQGLLSLSQGNWR
ncbi:putative homeobox domain-containing protein [Erysiphe neolycopersici]|uniref:Putative homeobox domain-containing protein n=1 Tax=Erysiphe neolycopersici TaxID=212602 RepID=A0A420HP46_9PEZI|nr:putative homeobox domain-containing protein [Erysiphe neolycopersici]